MMFNVFRNIVRSRHPLVDGKQVPKSQDSRIEMRQRAKNAMPKTVLGDCNTDGAKVLPNRQTLLRKIPSGGVACEVGVSRGDFSEDILSFNNPKKLHLVDSWDSERYKADLERVKDRFQNQISTGTIEIHQGLSTDVLLHFDDGYFDWVYIDTDHSYNTTAHELKICQRKVKVGGRIAGHDFCTGNVIKPVPYGVVEACNEFCVRENWRYEYITLDSDGHFSFSLMKN